MACVQRSCQNFNWDTILWPTDLCTFGFLHVFACKRDILEKTFIFNFARPLIRSETSQRGLATSTIRPSYCLFGSKKHMMGNIFQNRRMPFYMFGDTLYSNLSRQRTGFLSSKHVSHPKELIDKIDGRTIIADPVLAFGSPLRSCFPTLETVHLPHPFDFLRYFTAEGFGRYDFYLRTA